jgi:hypothetical protein
MPLARLAEPFDHADWIFELKYDGFRALARIESGQCRLISRNRNAFKSFAGLCAGIGAAICGEAILAGEIVYLDRDGVPRFYDLMRRRGPQCFYVFDLLWLDGGDLRELPQLEVVHGGPADGLARLFQARSIESNRKMDHHHDRRQGCSDARFEPELVHNFSGVGAHFVLSDLNKDGVPDIITSGPYGTFVFFQQVEAGDKVMVTWQVSAVGRRKSWFDSG